MIRNKWLGLILIGIGLGFIIEKLAVYGEIYTPPGVFDHGLYGVILIFIGAFIFYRRGGVD